MQCNGTETSLELCNFPGFGVVYSYCYAATVVCSSKLFTNVLLCMSVFVRVEFLFIIYTQICSLQFLM